MCFMMARGMGRRIGCGRTEVNVSVMKVEPPKRVLCPQNQVTPKASNSCTLSRCVISPCANRILVNAGPGQMDAATSMRSLTMSLPVRWWRGVRWAHA